jgi:hypothetical protein
MDIFIPTSIASKKEVLSKPTAGALVCLDADWTEANHTFTLAWKSCKVFVITTLRLRTLCLSLYPLLHQVANPFELLVVNAIISKA